MSAPPVPNSMTLYKRLLGYLKPYWQRFAISLVALAIAAATEPAFARLMKPLVDGGFVARDGWSMIWTPMAIVGLFLLRGITSFTHPGKGTGKRARCLPDWDSPNGPLRR